MKLKQEIEEYVPKDEREEKDKQVMLTYLNTFEDVLTRKNTLGHFTASGWIVNKERTKVLMAYHNIYQSWAWTGGHCDGDPNLLEVAIREAKEETGIKKISPISKKIAGIEVIGVDGHRKRGEYISEHVHLNVSYLVEADEKEELKIKADENSNVKWIPIEEVKNACQEEKMKPIYEKLNQQIREK